MTSRPNICYTYLTENNFLVAAAKMASLRDPGYVGIAVALAMSKQYIRPRICAMDMPMAEISIVLRHMIDNAVHGSLTYQPYEYQIWEIVGLPAETHFIAAATLDLNDLQTLAQQGNRYGASLQTANDLLNKIHTVLHWEEENKAVAPSIFRADPASYAPAQDPLGLVGMANATARH